MYKSMKQTQIQYNYLVPISYSYFQLLYNKTTSLLSNQHKTILKKEIFGDMFKQYFFIKNFNY